MKHNLKESEVKAYTQPMYDALLKYKKPEYARSELGIELEVWDEVIERTQMPEDIGTRQAALVEIAADIQRGINLLTDRSVPKSIVDKIIKCYNIFRDDDAIGGIIDTHINFGYEGFSVRSSDEKKNKKINDFNKKFDMDSIVLRLWGVATKTDQMILSWKKGAGGAVKYVTVFDLKLHLVKPLNTVDSKGKPQYEVYRKPKLAKLNEIDRLTRTKPKKMGRPPNAKYEKIPDSEKTLVRTVDGMTDRMVEPSMMRIFPDYELRRLIRDGDFTIFFHIKHMIHQIQVGFDESDPNSKAFWQKNLIPTEEQLQAILTKYKQSDKTMLEVSNAMQKHNFVAPDPKYLDDIKYKAVIKRIREWGSVQGLYSESTKYASGYLQIKLLRAKIRRWRKIMTRMLEEFYRETLGIDDVSIMWDEHNMLEPAQVLARLKAASEHGLSNGTFLDLLDFHSEGELELKKIENQHPEYYFMPFEAKQGITLAWLKQKGIIIDETVTNNPDEPGRPKSPDNPLEKSPSTAKKK